MEVSRLQIIIKVTFVVGFAQFLVCLGFLLILFFNLTTLPISKDPCVLMIAHENKSIEEFLFACCINTWSNQIKFKGCYMWRHGITKNSENSKNIHLFKRERQLVQYNFERIQRTIDTPWKI